MAAGVKTGGRKKGTPNKVTGEMRAHLEGVFAKLAPDIEGWIRAAADTDPGKAADLALKLAEFVTPKLQRAELTDGEGGPLMVTIMHHPRE